jgi:hypothetical protein
VGYYATRLIEVGSHPLISSTCPRWSDTVCEHVEPPVSGPEPALIRTVVSTNDNGALVKWDSTVVCVVATKPIQPVGLEGILDTAFVFCNDKKHTVLQHMASVVITITLCYSIWLLK